MLDSLTNVKARLNITGSTYDTFLTAQITLISDTIEAYCRRTFIEADYIQTFYYGDYVPTAMLELYHFPVSAVDAIVEDGTTLDVSEYRLHSPTGRVIRPGTRFNQGSFFQADVTTVAFTAGYAQSDLPTPILSVLDSLVQERYNKQTSGVNLNFGSDVQRISIPGAISIDFDYAIHNNDRKADFGVILGNNLNILDSYRSERTVLGSGRLEYIEVVP